MFRVFFSTSLLNFFTKVLPTNTMSHQKISPYNFFKGHPSTELLPSKEILKATQTILTTFDKSMAYYDGLDNTHPLNYGPDLGNKEVRSLIAQWNDELFKLSSPTDPNCINLTNGASSGLMNILLQLTSPFNGLTKRAFLVSPTYFLVNATLIDAGFAGKLIAIDEFQDGSIDFELLEKQLTEFETESPSKKHISKEDIPETYDPNRPMKKIFNYLLYIVPTFSNPKGGSLSIKDRHRLLQVARKYNMLIICDDVYDLLDYRTGKKDLYKRLVYLDRETLPEGDEYGHTISNATFSKLLGPGLRVGWQETATDKLALLLASGGANMSGGTPGHLNTVIVGEMIKNGSVEKIIGHLNELYKERSETLRNAVSQYLPKGTHISGFDGGYFSWVTLPEGYDNLAIAKKCNELGVVLATGDNFEVTGDSKGWGKHGTRLSISHLTATKIEEGIKIWGNVCKQYYC